MDTPFGYLKSGSKFEYKGTKYIKLNSAVTSIHNPVDPIFNSVCINEYSSGNMIGLNDCDKVLEISWQIVINIIYYPWNRTKPSI